jgi:hypothetical protein
MKTKLNVWISLDVRGITVRQLRNFFQTLKGDFEEVSKPQLAHVAIIGHVDQLNNSNIPHDILCLGINVPEQPEGIRPVSIGQEEVITNLCTALRAIRRHESILGIPT